MGDATNMMQHFLRYSAPDFRLGLLAAGVVLLVGCKSGTPEGTGTPADPSGPSGTGGAGGRVAGTGGNPVPAGTGGAAPAQPPVVDTGGGEGPVVIPTTGDAMAGGGGEAGGGVDTGTAKAPMVVAAAGDIAAAEGGDERTTATLLHKVHAETPLKAILMLGDGAYRFARLEEYRRLYEPTWGVPAFKAITRPIPGNHEYLENPSGNGYYDYWNGVGAMTGPAGERGKGYYSFELDAWHVIALNSNEDCRHVPCGEGSPQLAWLKSDLAANRSFCTLAMVHHPRFQNGTHRGDTPALQAAWAAMYGAGVDVVLAAHEHNYQQFAPMDATGKLDVARGMRSFVVGTGGGRDFREVFSTAHMATEEKRIVNQSGVLFLNLEERTFSWRWLHLDGRVGASGNGACH
jgi:acid phosphatase type 7